MQVPGICCNHEHYDSSGTSHIQRSHKRTSWKYAMAEEYESIMKNDVWDVVPRPKGKSVVTSKWLFKVKHGLDGSIEK